MDLIQEICSFCKNTPKKYTCPHCNADYCSLICFQSTDHIKCAESFYQKRVLENMPLSGNDDESKEKMMEVCKTLKTLQEHDKLDCENGNLGDDIGMLDSNDDTEQMNLQERLANIDLDDNEVLQNLTPDERQEFEAFLSSGDVSTFVPKWEPWWLLLQCNLKFPSVGMIQSLKEKCPVIIQDIKVFSSITQKIPSSCVKYNLVNIIAAYAFTVRHFNGEHFNSLEGAVGCIVSLSLCLRDNKMFEDGNSAIASVHEEYTKNEWITDEDNMNLMREDVKLILNGPWVASKKLYILCALSDLYNLVNSLLNKGKAHGVNCFLKHSHMYKLPMDKTKLCLKKLEYFLSYTVCYYE